MSAWRGLKKTLPQIFAWGDLLCFLLKKTRGILVLLNHLNNAQLGITMFLAVLKSV